MQNKNGISRFVAAQIMLASLLCMLLAQASTAMAQGLPRDSDYFAEVAVNGQDPTEQSSAQRVAMRIILLRTSSDKTLLNQEGIRRALASAQDFILASDYRVPGADDRITTKTPITPKVRKTSEATHILGMSFDAAAIGSLIAGQSEQEEVDPDAPPAPAPNTALAWLLIDDGNAEHRIGGQTGSNVIERSREIAGGVGQVIVFPEQDDSDRLALSADDIRAGNQQRIDAASMRYQQGVVLTGILKRSIGRGWTANWSRYYNAEVVDQSFEASSLDQALQQGISWLAGLRNAPLSDPGANSSDNNAAQSSEPAYQPFGARERDSADAGYLWVSRVSSTESYAAVVQLIQEVESVAVVYPKQVLPGGMLFSVSPRYAINDVAQRLAGVSWIAPVATLGENGFAQVQSADAYFEYLR